MLLVCVYGSSTSTSHRYLGSFHEIVVSPRKQYLEAIHDYNLKGIEEIERIPITLGKGNFPSEITTTKAFHT